MRILGTDLSVRWKKQRKKTDMATNNDENRKKHFKELKAYVAVHLFAILNNIHRSD